MSCFSCCSVQHPSENLHSTSFTSDPSPPPSSTRSVTPEEVLEPSHSSQLPPEIFQAAEVGRISKAAFQVIQRTSKA